MDDIALLSKLEAELLRRAGGAAAFQREVPLLLRRAIDEVIDAPRTARFTIDQIEKTEKTYIGTKVEILFRNFLGIPKGLLDLEIDGTDVDIKNTVTGNWMIPRESFGKPCVLISANEKTGMCRVGLIVTHEEYLTSGANRDQKKSISAAGMKHARWLISGPYPRNFWEGVPRAAIQQIMAGRGGSERLYTLFKLLQRTAISRQIVEAVAQQKDYMKRLRKNGGARDRLAAEGIAVLSGTYDKLLISRIGLPACSDDEFIAVAADTEEIRNILRAHNHI